MRSIEERQGSPLFSFYDGPPFATGLPHYGHLLAGTIKDVIPRYKTMQGFCVPRTFGWDCHGLPVENEIEKAHELSGASSIESFGIAKFNEECRKIVLRYTGEWKKTIDRMGRWVDLEKTYRTMDPSFMESVWWVFKELFAKGLVYEGFKVMPFSTKLGTPLSNFEANLNYKDVDDPSLIVQFTLFDTPNTYFLAWTTTPWTLPSNLALMVHPTHTYALVEDPKTEKRYILAEARIAAIFKEPPHILETFPGTKLQDQKYRPLLPFFETQEGAFKILLEESVSMDDGTGIVHAAPAFGEVDFFACRRENIEIVCPIDANGKFTVQVPPYAGIFVKDADKEIIRDLKKQGAIFSHSTINHRYPFCWRSDTPLIYKAVQTWFVAVETIREDLLKSNEQITWMPSHIKEGRFGKWLENARDWAISRNRYWGTPIPLWRSPSGKIHVIGSIQELETLTLTKVTDLHRHHIDSLTFEKEGEIYTRIPEVFDCWFESGSMPYAEKHYPFSHKEAFAKCFPADFIAEGLDQTRGWFYTLTVLATALFKKPAFKNVIVNGIILAADGNKMSKRLKNYPDPDVVIQKTGADAIRLYMLQSPAVKAEDLRFSEHGVEQVLRGALIPLWNCFVFLSTYAKIYHWKPSVLTKKPTALIDQWMLSITQKMIAEMQSAFDNYDLNQAVLPFVACIEELTNWYIRRCRSRFWADADNPDRHEAFATLYTVLLDLIHVAAPLVPFVTEAIYQEIKTETMPDSIHLGVFPKYNAGLRNTDLEEEVKATQRAVSLGHCIRKEYKLKVRQPLAKAYLISSNEQLLKALEKQKALIGEELNVKEVELRHDETEFVQWVAKPNFPVLGKKIGKLIPQAQKIIAGLHKSQLARLAEGHPIEITVEGTAVTLEKGDVQIERKVKTGVAAGNDNDLTVALDTELNAELLEEGLARELINKINTMRKEMDFAVTDRIALTLHTTPKVEQCFTKYRDYIAGEVLATKITFGPCSGAPVDLNGEQTLLLIEKN